MGEQLENICDVLTLWENRAATTPMVRTAQVICRQCGNAKPQHLVWWDMVKRTWILLAASACAAGQTVEGTITRRKHRGQMYYLWR